MESAAVISRIDLPADLDWNARLTELLQPGRLYRVVVNGEASVAAKIKNHLIYITGQSAPDFAWLDEPWWTWSDVDRVVDHATLTEDGKLSVYSGALMKRLSKALHRRMHIDLDRYQLDRLGTLYAESVAGAGEYLIDFTQDTTWRGGDFGDDGSCFFYGGAGVKTVSRLMLEGAGADFRAMRFYANTGERAYDTGRGIGRAWLILRVINNVRVPFVFNAYWHSGGTVDSNHDRKGIASNITRTVARVLATHLDGYTERLRLYADIYINSGLAYAVYPIGTRSTEEYALHLPKVKEPTVYCSDCQQHISGVDIYTDDDNATFCRACYCRRYFTCARCGNEYSQPAAGQDSWGDPLCDDCFVPLA